MYALGYLYKAMNYFKKQFQNTVFIVCSDDMDWCKRNIQPNPNVVFVEGSAFDNMAVLAACNHSIISTGNSFHKQSKNIVQTLITLISASIEVKYLCQPTSR